jgi:ubiquinone/menaquinone biosynthesis C-methylase UbiE
MFKVGTTNESERVAWIEKTLKKIPAGLTVLDAGAGESQFKKFCTHLTYVAQDFGQYEGTGDVGLQTGTWDNSKLDIVSDITTIPRPDASFDAIMCTEVLEHVPDAVAALKELNRLLKPGGFLLITAPFTSLTHFAPYHFATGFSRFFYEHHLKNFGYEIVDLEINGNYFEDLGQEIRRIKRMAKEYAGIKLSFFDKIITHLLLLRLQHFSAKGNRSNEILAHGIHVFARKS